MLWDPQCEPRSLAVHSCPVGNWQEVFLFRWSATPVVLLGSTALYLRPPWLNSVPLFYCSWSQLIRFVLIATRFHSLSQYLYRSSHSLYCIPLSLYYMLYCINLDCIIRCTVFRTVLVVLCYYMLLYSLRSVELKSYLPFTSGVYLSCC